MNDYNNKIKYLVWELILLFLLVWMGKQANTYNQDINSFSAAGITKNNPGNELGAKLSMFIDFVKKHNSTDTDLDRKYVNKGLIYLSGVLNAMIHKHYQDNAGMNDQREKLLKINMKILNADSLSAENLKTSLLTASKIIAGIQASEFPDLSKASADLKNSAMKIDQNETFEVLKFKTAEFFERSSDIFIAMAILKAHRNNEIRKDFYNIRST